jgi:Protein of unknown function (DUF2934)
LAARPVLQIIAEFRKLCPLAHGHQYSSFDKKLPAEFCGPRKDQGAMMATQTARPTQSSKSKANSHAQVAQNAQPEILANIVTKLVHPVMEPLSDEQRRELIAVTAYYLAESRNFQPGHEDEDWLTAEGQIGSLGATVS